MADRALHAAWNVGIETVVPTGRTVHATWNVGVEIMAANAVRAMHAAWNVGIETLTVLRRALHAVWSVMVTTHPTDPAEWWLYDSDLETVEHILRGK